MDIKKAFYRFPVFGGLFATVVLTIMAVFGSGVPNEKLPGSLVPKAIMDWGGAEISFWWYIPVTMFVCAVFIAWLWHISVMRDSASVFRATFLLFFLTNVIVGSIVGLLIDCLLTAVLVSLFHASLIIAVIFLIMAAIVRIYGYVVSAVSRLIQLADEGNWFAKVMTDSIKFYFRPITWLFGK